jgi:hypothetical protein
VALRWLKDSEMGNFWCPWTAMSKKMVMQKMRDLRSTYLGMQVSGILFGSLCIFVSSLWISSSGQSQ